MAFNESDRIGATLARLEGLAERIVVDSGSTDDTVSIAQMAGARVIQTDWPGFFAQRVRAAAWASNDLIWMIDADERPDAQLLAAVLTLQSQPTAAAGYRIARHTRWLGAPIRHGVWTPDRQIRLFDRRQGKWAAMDPHPVWECPRALHLPGLLIHDPFRNLGEHLQKIANYSETAARAAWEAGRRAGPLDLCVRPAAHLFKALILKAGLLDGVAGLCVGVLGATATLLKWSRLWQIQREPRWND